MFKEEEEEKRKGVMLKSVINSSMLDVCMSTTTRYIYYQKNGVYNIIMRTALLELFSTESEDSGEGV